MWLGTSCKPPHGPRLEPKVIWSERYFSANNIHKGNVKIYKSTHTHTIREREERHWERRGFNVFYTMYNSKNETIDCLEDVVCGT